MKQILVLGPGCKRCQTTADMIESAAHSQQVAVTIHKITDPAEIIAHGVMSTPGVVVDGVLVHSGGLPHADDIADWLSS